MPSTIINHGLNLSLLSRLTNISKVLNHKKMSINYFLTASAHTFQAPAKYKSA